jgi:hypothetical protein
MLVTPFQFPVISKLIAAAAIATRSLDGSFCRLLPDITCICNFCCKVGTSPDEIPVHLRTCDFDFILPLLPIDTSRVELLYPFPWFGFLVRRGLRRKELSLMSDDGSHPGSGEMRRPA